MYGLTLGSISFAETPTSQIVAAAAAAGFVGCGLRIAGRKPGDPGPTLVGDRKGLAELRNQLTQAGLKISNVVAYQFSPTLELEALKPVVEAAGELGGRMLSAVCQDPDESRFIDKVGGYAAMAAKIGARVNIEFIPYSEAKTIGQAARIARAAGDNIGLKIDPLHLTRGGGSPADIKNIDPKLIYMAQLCDAPREKSDQLDLATESRTSRLYPGEGGLPLFEFLDALPAHVTDLELGVPHGAHKHETPQRQAELMFQATRRFFETYQRRKPS